MSVSTGVRIDCNGTVKLGVGSIIYSNHYTPMFKIEKDDVGSQDLLFPACTKKMYDYFYNNGDNHPNCLDNLNLVLGTNKTVIQPVNFFMNTTH